MFERFTDSARRVIVEADKVARELNYGYVGAENLLFGIIKLEREGAAPPVLISMDVTSELFRDTWLKILNMSDSVEKSQGSDSNRLPFTPRAKRVLELSLREALSLGHNYAGAEHILLASMHESDGLGVEILKELGADPSEVRERTIESFSPDASADQLERLQRQIQLAKSQIPFLEKLAKGSVAARTRTWTYQKRARENRKTSQEI